MALSQLFQETDPAKLKALIVQRIINTVPTGWSSVESLQPGGNVYAVLDAFAGELAGIVLQLIYGKNSLRFATATEPELSIDSADFFGGSLPPPAGFTDAQYAQLITASLFQAQVIRSAIERVVAANVGAGATFRLLELFRAADTARWGSAYWGVDTPANPGRLANCVPGIGLLEITAPAGYTLPPALLQAINTTKAEGVLVGVRVLIEGQNNA